MVPIHINHVLYRDCVPTDANRTLQHELAYCKLARGESKMILGPKIRLLDHVRQAKRLKNYPYSTEKAYVYWLKLRPDRSLPTPYSPTYCKDSTFFVYTTRAWAHLLW